MRIRFTKHASEKFILLRKHGFYLTKTVIMNAIRNPEWVDHSRLPLLHSANNAQQPTRASCCLQRGEFTVCYHYFLSWKKVGL